MKVNVRFFGLSDLVKDRQATVTLPARATYGELLKALVDTYGERLGERLLKEDGRLQDDVNLVVEEKTVPGLEQRVESQATVYIIFQIAGGGGDPDGMPPRD